MNNIKTICDEFKEQVWLYLEPDTDIQVREFWKKHLTNCIECSIHLESTRKFLAGYSNIPSEELTEEKYIEIIQNVTSKKKYSFIETFTDFLYFIKHYFGQLNKYKLAFGSMLVVLIFTLILFFREYKPRIEIKQTSEVKSEIPSNNIELKSSSVEQKDIQKIGGVKMKPKYFRAAFDDHWDIDIKSISIQIELLRKQTDELEF